MRLRANRWFRAFVDEKLRGHGPLPGPELRQLARAAGYGAKAGRFQSVMGELEEQGVVEGYWEEDPELGQRTRWYRLPDSSRNSGP